MLNSFFRAETAIENNQFSTRKRTRPDISVDLDQSKVLKVP